MKDKSIKVQGMAVGDESVGINSVRFMIDTGLAQMDDDDRKDFVETVIHMLWEFYDNGDIYFDFSDGGVQRQKFGYDDAKKIKEEWRCRLATTQRK